MSNAGGGSEGGRGGWLGILLIRSGPAGAGPGPRRRALRESRSIVMDQGWTVSANGLAAGWMELVGERLKWWVCEPDRERTGDARKSGPGGAAARASARCAPGWCVAWLSGPIFRSATCAGVRVREPRRRASLDGEPGPGHGWPGLTRPAALGGSVWSGILPFVNPDRCRLVRT